MIYHFEYGNRYGVSYINTSDKKYIRETVNHLRKLGGYNIRLYIPVGEGFQRIDLDSFMKEAQ